VQQYTQGKSSREQHATESNSQSTIETMITKTNSPSCVAASSELSERKTGSGRMSMIHSPLSWKKPFARAAPRLKRVSGVSKRTLNDSSLSGTRTMDKTHSSSSTAHTIISPDVYGNCSEDSDSYNRSPASTASPGTLKRKKLRKRALSKAPPAPLDLSPGTPIRKSLDDVEKRPKRRSSEKPGDFSVQKDPAPRKSKKELDSPRKRKSKKVASKDPPGTKSIGNSDLLEEKVVDVEAAPEGEEKSKVKKKKKKKKTAKKDGEKKKKKLKKSESKNKETSGDGNIDKSQQEGSRSLHSYGSFSLNGDTRDEGDQDASIRSEAGATAIRTEIYASMSSDTGFQKAHSERPSHFPRSILKPCLRKISMEEPSFLNLGASAPSCPATTHDGDQSVSSEEEFILPLASTSGVKLGDFIQTQRPPSFDPFAGVGAPGYDRNAVSGGSIDLCDLFEAVSLDGTKSTDGSFDADPFSSNKSSSRRGSQRTSRSRSRSNSRSASPGRLTGRKKALIGDWTAPVDASDHWSSCHERRSLDCLSVPDMNNSYHGSFSTVTKSRTRSNRLDLDKSKGDSTLWNSADDIDLRSGHSRLDISTCDESGQDEFADDLFDIDIDNDDFLSDDDIKEDEDDDEPSTKKTAGQGRNLQRQISDTSFDGPSSDDELAAFDDAEDDGCSYHEKRSTDGSIPLPPGVSDDPEEDLSSCQFEILQMTPRTKTKFMTKRKKLAMAAAVAASD
jgi:hypothetical protein